MAQVNLPLNLTDGDGFLWDIQSNGSISNGTNDAYDGGLFIPNFFTSVATGETEDNDREVAIGPATPFSNIEITRKIFVPDNQGWARFLTTVTNTSNSATNYSLQILSNFGSDGGTQTISTSSGDTTFDTNDDWLITDDFSNGGGDPTLIHIVSGLGGIDPTTASLSGDNLNFTYDLSLAAGESQSVLVFASQNQNQATALTKAPLLADLQLGALDGLSGEELSQLVNFATEGLSISDAVVTEGDSGTTNVELTVQLINGPNEIVTVDYATANDTALAGEDYVAQSGTLTFNPGDTTQTISITVNGDLDQEVDETFFVNLSNASTNTTLNNSQAVVTIDNDDLIDVDVELSLLVDVSGSVDNSEYELQLEGYVAAFNDPDLFNNFIGLGINGQVAVNVVLWSSGVNQVESIGWTLIDSVQASQNFAQDIQTTLLPDFGGSRPFSGGTQPSLAIDFAVPLFFSNEFDGRRLTMDVSGDGTGNAFATAQSRDNALAGGIDAINGIVIGGGSFVLDFYQNSLIGGTNADGTPAFALQANTFTEFANVVEQKLAAELSPPPLVTINDVGNFEGNNGTTDYVFNVNLSKTSEQTVTVDFATADGTATTLDSDYNPVSGTLTFAPGDITKEVIVQVNGDTNIELDENFFVNLTNPVNGDIADSQGVGTILNDDQISNLPPVANDDNLTTDQDIAITIGVNQLLANDTDPNPGDTLSVDSVSNAVNGSVTLINGNIEFTPDANFIGNASFEYTISDNDGLTDTATVNVDVIERPPIIGTPDRDGLTGTDFDDVIIGLSGRDTIITGGGNDTLVYESIVDAGDIITDFEVGNDIFDLSGLLNRLNYTGSDPIGDGYVKFGSQGNSNSFLIIDPDGLTGTGTDRILALVEGVSDTDLANSSNFIF
jgi:hypothetical protein